MADRGPTERRHFVRCDSLLPHGARHLLLTQSTSLVSTLAFSTKQ